MTRMCKTPETGVAMGEVPLKVGAGSGIAGVNGGIVGGANTTLGLGDAVVVGAIVGARVMNRSSAIRVTRNKRMSIFSSTRILNALRKVLIKCLDA